MGNKTAAQAKKAAAQAKEKKAAADKKKKEKGPRKPRMSAEDFALIKFGCEALIEAEEEKELAFHRKHTVNGVKDGVPQLFIGDYKKLCNLLDVNDQPYGTVLRTKAQILWKRVAPHVGK